MVFLFLSVTVLAGYEQVEASIASADMEIQISEGYQNLWGKKSGWGYGYKAAVNKSPTHHLPIS
jgi:hypothetical protein